MNGPESIPAQARRDVAVVVARGRLAEVERLDLVTANASVLVRLIEGLDEAVRGLLDVLDGPSEGGAP